MNLTKHFLSRTGQGKKGARSVGGGSPEAAVISNAGFSLIEILVVMGLLVLMSGFGLFVSMETYQGSNFSCDRSLFVAALQRARAQAIHNMCYGTCTDGVAHGVHVDTAAG